MFESRVTNFLKSTTCGFTRFTVFVAHLCNQKSQNYTSWMDSAPLNERGEHSEHMSLEVMSFVLHSLWDVACPIQ